MPDTEVDETTELGRRAVAFWFDGEGELPPELPYAEDASVWMWEAVWYELINRAETPGTDVWGMHVTRKMPRPDQIASFWAPVWSYLRWGKEWSFRGQCWACGLKSLDLQRAHVLPVNAHGSDNVENIHLLCKICHAVSEDMHGQVYYEWLWASMMYAVTGLSMPIETMRHLDKLLQKPRYSDPSHDEARTALRTALDKREAALESARN